MGKKEDTLQLNLDLDIKKSLQGIQKFEREMKKRMGSVQKATKAAGKASKQVTDKAVKDTRRWIVTVDDLTASYDKDQDAIDALTRKVETLTGKSKVNAMASLKALKQVQKERMRSVTSAKGRKDQVLDAKSARGAWREAKKGWFDFKKEISNSKDTFKTLSDGVKAAFGKDAKGALEGAIKGGVKAFRSITEGVGAGLMKGAGRLKKKGAEKGGMGGAALKAIGGLTGGIGKMFGWMSKLGPFLGMISEVVVSLVKMFIDLDAEAKEFNRDILASASSAEMVAQGAKNLKETLKDIRDAALDFSENNAWGITQEQHKQVINSLTQEGVSISRITKEAELAGQSVKEFASELTHVSVAYSRAFGVPLQEINQLQSEMMTDLGMSLDDTRLAFSQMTRSATESGIAANKFFGMIRGVSQDLSMYNTRMDQATKTLKLLGKVMNPREAQKFLQIATQGLKNMSQDDRLKLALLTGGKGAKIVEKDLENRTKNLASDIASATGGDAASIAEQIKQNPKIAQQLISGIKDAGKRGSLTGSAMELEQDKIASKKGVYGQAFAMENMSMGGSLKMLQESIGGGNLTSKAGDLGMTKFSELVGISTQQLRGMMKLEQAVEAEKNEMLAKAKTQDEKNAINAMDTQDIIDQMSKEEQDALQDDTKTLEEFAKEQGQLTQGIDDKLANFIDFIKKEIYGVLVDIFDAFANSPFGSESARVKAQYLKSDDPNIKKAYETAAKNEKGEVTQDAFNRKINETTGVGANVSKAVDVMKKTGGNEFVENRLRDMAGEIGTGLVDNEITTGSKYMLQMRKNMGGINENVTLEDMQRNDKVTAASKGVVGEERANAVEAMLNTGVFDNIYDAMKAAGLNIDEIGKVLGKASENISANNVGGQGYRNVQRFGAEVDKTMLPGTSTFAGPESGGPEKELEALPGMEGSLDNLDKKGVKLDGTFTKGPYKKTVKEASYEAYSDALYTDYLMRAEKVDKEKVDELIKSGASPQDIFSQIRNLAQQAPENAAGGLVTDVHGGLAMIRAAAGEGLASVGPGERILPAGASSGMGIININVGGIGGSDLANIIRTRVMDGIAEYKRRERFT